MHLVLPMDVLQVTAYAAEVLLYCSCRGSLICSDAPFLPELAELSATLLPWCMCMFLWTRNL